MTDLNQIPHLITTDVNTEQRNVNIGNVNSRTVNSSNVNCTNKNGEGQEGSYCYLERYFHGCRVAERDVDKFKKCPNCQCVYYCGKSCQLKGWK